MESDECECSCEKKRGAHEGEDGRAALVKPEQHRCCDRQMHAEISKSKERGQARDGRCGMLNATLEEDMQ